MINKKITYKVKKNLKCSRNRYARAFSAVISAFININIDLENRKLGNLTSKHQIERLQQ